LQLVAKPALSFLLIGPNPVRFRQLLFQLTQGNFEFNFIEKIRLKRQLLASGNESLHCGQQQVFLEQINAFAMFIKDDVIFFAEAFLVSLKEFVFLG